MEKQKGKKLYDDAEHSLEKLNRRGLGLYKYFFSEKYLAEKAEIQKQIADAEDCMNMKGMSVSDFKQIIYARQYEEAKPKVCPPCFVVEERYFATEEEFLKFTFEC